MNIYLNDTDLYYEIILSKGRGYLTDNAIKYFDLLAKNIIRKKQKKYRNNDDLMDCMYSGLLKIYQNWYNFNEKQYKNAIPYFTEIYKRGIASAFNDIVGKSNKYRNDDIKFISINNINDGKGVYNF